MLTQLFLLFFPSVSLSLLAETLITHLVKISQLCCLVRTYNPWKSKWISTQFVCCWFHSFTTPYITAHSIWCNYFKFPGETMTVGERSPYKMWERAMFESSLPEMKTKATHWWSWEKSKVFFAGITRGFITRRLNVWLNTPQKFFNRSQGEKHHMRPVHCHAPKGIRDPLHQCRAWQWVEGFHLEIRVLLPSL